MDKMKYIPGTTYAACVFSDSIWFTLKRINCLCEFKDGKVYPHVIPMKGKSSDKLYSSIVACDGKLYLFPAYAQSIAIYDIEKDFFSILDDEWLHKQKEGEKFVNAFLCRGMIWGIPGNDDFILCYSPSKGIEKKILWRDALSDQYPEVRDNALNSAVYDGKQYIYAGVDNSDLIIKIDTIAETLTAFRLGVAEKYDYPEIAYSDDQLFWVSDAKGTELYSYSSNDEALIKEVQLEKPNTVLRNICQKYIVADYLSEDYADVYDLDLNHKGIIRKETKTGSRWFDLTDSRFFRIDGV